MFTSNRTLNNITTTTNYTTTNTNKKYIQTKEKYNKNKLQKQNIYLLVGTNKKYKNKYKNQKIQTKNTLQKKSSIFYLNLYCSMYMFDF